MKKIGKIGKINIKANKKLKQIYAYKGISSCEIQLKGCMGIFGLSFAHKHKRVWYYDRPELLGSFNETLMACAFCHSRLEDDPKLTIATFKRLR